MYRARQNYQKAMRKPLVTDHTTDSLSEAVGEGHWGLEECSGRETPRGDSLRTQFLVLQWGGITLKMTSGWGSHAVWKCVLAQALSQTGYESMDMSPVRNVVSLFMK